MQCSKHPDLPAKFRCEKFDVSMCEQCLECRSPELYCKHRQHCLIWELVREDLSEDSKGEHAAGT